MITIGIDPDAQAHGVAVYEGKKLVALYQMDLFDIVNHVVGLGAPVQFSIENVLQNKFIYARNDKANKALQAKVGLSVGRCQQAQVELQRWLDRAKIPYQLHRPQKGNWAKHKAVFEKATGWTGRSNEDTRSAAYFGYLAV